jgi:phage shock protein PspC (stress-responsive transcriptional regulator)
MKERAMSDKDTTSDPIAPDAGANGEPAAAAARDPLRRPPDRVLGGVCAAVADRLGLDVALVRLAAVVLLLLSGGTAVIAYLIGWVLIPSTVGPTAQFTEAPAAPDADAWGNAWRAAWRAAGADLRALGAELKPERVGDTPSRPAPGPRGTVDATLTGLGDRLRDPQVQARARRAATAMSTAVDTSFDRLTRRG